MRSADADPAIKLAEKHLDGAHVRMKYPSPATPYKRLLDNPRTPLEVVRRIGMIYTTLDPVCLLRDFRARQQRLADMADTPLRMANATKSPPLLSNSLASLKTALLGGEPNPATRPKPNADAEGPIRWRRSTPRSRPGLQQSAKDLRKRLDRLQSAYPRKYGDGHLRTLQQRLKHLRRQVAHNLIVGVAQEAAPNVTMSQFERIGWIK